MLRNLLLMSAAALVLSGCLAKTALDVATAPVKVASRAVDLATTSQAEADQKRGRELRKREQKLGKLQRDYHKQQKACAAGSAKACTEADKLAAQIAVILPTVPAEPD